MYTEMNFLAMDKIFCLRQKIFVPDKFYFFFDKIYFVWADGMGISLCINKTEYDSVQPCRRNLFKELQELPNM